MTNKQTIERYWHAIVARDLDTVEDCYHPDVVVRYPQSREVFNGREKYMGMLRAYPGLPLSEAEELYGDEKTVVVPSAQPFGRPVVTVTGGDELFVGHARLTYEDGTMVHSVSIFRVQHGLIVSETSYFAEPFDPPPWRAQFCEYE